jgi:hypothetical protein
MLFMVSSVSVQHTWLARPSFCKLKAGHDVELVSGREVESGLEGEGTRKDDYSFVALCS